MKKLFATVIGICLLLSVNCFADNIKIMVDGVEIEADTPAQLVNNRTLVPVRPIFEALGAEVSWDGSTKTVTAVKGENIISMVINGESLVLNGESIALDVPATIINGRTMVPARAVSEAMGCEVSWNSDDRIVEISTLSDYIEAIADEKLSELHKKTRYSFEQKALPQALFDAKSENISDLKKFASNVWDNNNLTYILKYMIDDEQAYVISGDSQLRKIISQFEIDAALQESQNISYSSITLDENTCLCLLDMAKDNYIGYCEFIAVVYNKDYGIRYFTLEQGEKGYTLYESTENSKTQVIVLNTVDKHSFVEVLKAVM